MTASTYEQSTADAPIAAQVRDQGPVPAKSDIAGLLPWSASYPLDPWYVAGRQPLQRNEQCACDEECAHRAEQREHEPLGERLTEQSSQARAKRDTDRDLRSPRRGSHQQQCGDVHTRDDEDETCGGKEREQHAPALTGDALDQWLNEDCC